MIKKESIRYLVLSDIHLGHKRTQTKHIIESIRQLFNGYKPRNDLDIIFLAGDVFDRLLDFSLHEVNEIVFWVHRLMAYCGANKIKLRVLRGTPSHDWEQSLIFRTIHSAAYNEVDFKYIDTLAVEIIEDLGLSVLYVPDEWHNDTNETFRQSVKLVEENHLTQVDIAIMHGNFTYQLPVQAVKAPRHNEQDYLNLVKYFISIGHIHTHSTFERILAQGSVDRLAHGEEEKKGCMEMVIHRDGTGEYYFIENKNAKIFKTITIKPKDVDGAIKQIERSIYGLPIDSYIRLRASKQHPIIIGFEEVKRRFPNIVLSKITLEEEAELQSDRLIDEQDIDVIYQPISITKDNIKQLLMECISDKMSLSHAEIGIFDKVMEDVI